ncbi:outer membrane beta-barrel protein [Mucilaginibacter lutimaris]|uniref:Outer membrane beta-barrel protein n=1 Tax=Mucilaginibacter lutimaris TaxID=931629 RepID=A0ABW2ZJL8_9SPHI
MKKYLLFIALTLAFINAKAQGSLNYATYGIGVSASLNKAYADLKKQDSNKSYAVTFNYFFTPYVPIGLEFQFGKLSGGSNTDLKVDKDGRQYLNNYKALILHMDVQAGELMDYQGSTILNVLKNFYAGAGIGGISNSVETQRTSVLDPTYTFPGTNSSVNLIVPLRFGYEFKFYNAYDQPNIRLDIGYQHNLTFGEGLDGYADPSTNFKNNALDQYRQITVGIKVNFGGQNSYDKEIRGY